ncbi:hypothetical protein LWI29_012110 [Acer saccharum]|uniref:Uncharacterized protein n=1 Tax=Acer saccharum TaxID=4024 RepID=A0AA39S8M3_ACESA|nr:hypothetical protein LWI29_012110 [Acer saccharum]
MDVDTAVVSDHKGSIAVLSCSNILEGWITKNARRRHVGTILGAYKHATRGVLSLPYGPPNTVKSSSKRLASSPIAANKVVQLLEQVHYALN